MLKEKQTKDPEELLRWAAFDFSKSSIEDTSTREIMRKVSESVGEKIERIFSRAPAKKSK